MVNFWKHSAASFTASLFTGSTPTSSTYSSRIRYRWVFFGPPIDSSLAGWWVSNRAAIYPFTVIISRYFLIVGLCERALVSSVNVRSCVAFYCVAEEVGAANLLEYCSSLISINWDELLPQDFISMSGPLLYKMLKTKTKHPLHSAVRLRREDVVFLCLVENDGTVS